MPDVIVKLLSGKSEEQKDWFAKEIVKDVMNVLNYGEESVSVAFEEVTPQDWLNRSTNLISLTTRRSCTRNPVTM
jgi:4-oxalocrotonate tautomerase